MQANYNLILVQNKFEFRTEHEKECLKNLNAFAPFPFFLSR